MASGYTFHNNVAPFPSRPVQPRPTSTFPQPPLRTLPTFGSPNEFPNPSSHYFPSKPGAYNKRDTRTRSPESEDDTAAAGDERARKAPLGPFPSAVGAGGGARRRLDRTTWDAGSELMREEAEEQAKAAGGAAAAAGASGGADVDMDQDRDDDNDDNADAKSTASGKDTSKKRSRTLTTAHQTAVLNALLAKTRFPSTETREEVGQQIGMSARRVQIWFQNRRQSQKRARDREASEMTTGAPYAHHEYHRPDPYGRYPPPHSSASSSSTVRPGLSRQTSMDSMASFASAHSSVSSFQQQRDTLSPLSEVAPRWPGAAPQAYGQGWGQHGPLVTPPSDPRSHYFAQSPPVPPRQGSMGRPHEVDDGRPRTSSVSVGGTDAMKLPSLSAVLGSALPDQPQAHRAPPPAPSSGTRSFANPQSTFSPPMSPTTSRPFDDFSRLRISSEREGAFSPPADPYRRSSPPDILDVAMETMYRPTALPARSQLPPLRSAVARQGPSEADAALLAPILPSSSYNSSAATSTRLPPISALSLNTPTLPFATTPPQQRSSTWSQQSASSASGQTGRSSVSSFDTLGTWAPHSVTSSRTSFSSEVQEEWERMSAAGVFGGRKVKSSEVCPWEGDTRERRAGGPSVPSPVGEASQEEIVRMGSP